MTKITQSIADALNNNEVREVALNDRYKLIGLKEDVRKGHLLIMGRFVDDDLNVTTKLVDLQEIGGSKQAIDKVDQIERALKAFVQNRVQAFDKLRARVVSYCADLSVPRSLLPPNRVAPPTCGRGHCELPAILSLTKIAGDCDLLAAGAAKISAVSATERLRARCGHCGRCEFAMRALCH